jgi:hypothetical protein
VTSWCRRHTISGDGTVAAARRGQAAAESAALSREQELDLIDTLRGCYPDQVGLDGELWTRQSLTAFARQRYGLPPEVADMGRYLRAWGLGPREPTERACRLCVDAVSRWMTHEYPTVSRAAQEHCAELHWVGHTRLYGVSPPADVLSATSAHGRIHFAIAGPPVDPAQTREFLLRLSGAEGRTVHAIVDASWSRAEWPRRMPRRIVLYPLPSCGRGA